MDTVYYDARTEAPFAVKFKNYAFTPEGGIDGEYPRCPLAGHSFGLASLKRVLITYSELSPPGGEDA